MKSNFKLKAIVIASFVIILAGCGKNAASIAGLWTLTSQRGTWTIHNVIVRDTTLTIVNGPQLNLTSDGHYSLHDQYGTTHGTYSYGAGTLAVFDSLGHPEAYFPNASVSDHSLSYAFVDTLHGTQDTVSTITETYSR